MFHPACATWKGGTRFPRVRVRLLACGAAACIALALPAVVQAATEQLVAARDVPASMAVDDAGRAVLATGARVRSAPPGSRFGRARTVMRPGPACVLDVGIAADGSGLVFVEGPGREVRAVPVGSRAPTGGSGSGADFAAAALAPNGAAIVVWFRHRRGGRWRLEASVRERGASAFGRPEALSGFVRRACCTKVSAAIGARGDAVVTWRSTARASVCAWLRRPRRRLHGAQRLAASAPDDPNVGAGGAAAVIYGTERVPPTAADGLQLRRATSDRFGPPERTR
jgi:hypothetical protein